METYKDIGRSGMVTSIVLVFLQVWTVAGCGSARVGSGDRKASTEVATEGVLYLNAVPVKRLDVDERDYELGKRSTIEIGEPLIHIRVYSEEDTVSRARFRQQFAVRCVSRHGAFGAAEPADCQDEPLAELRAETGDIWAVAGVRSDSPTDAAIYLIAKSVTGGTMYLLVDASGNLIGGRNVAWRSVDAARATSAGLSLRLVTLDLPLKISGPLVELQRHRRVVHGPSHLNFDLLYSGRGRSRRGESVRLLYKEYSPYLPGRQIYSEELTYGLGPGAVTFRNFRIRIHQATDREITYTLESDAAKGGVNRSRRSVY